jgi:HK97 family phage portal protein
VANIFQRVFRSFSASNPNSIIYQMFGGTTTASGESVSPTNAPQVATVYACVTLISDTIASLPFNVYLKTEQGNKLYQSHPLDKLISRRPNEKYNSIDFRRALINQMLLNGNGYVLPLRTGNALTGLELVPADHVQVNYQYGNLTYDVYLNDKLKLTLNPDQIIHLKAYTQDGYHGISPITYARQTIGSSLAASKHLAQHYGKGGVPPGYLELNTTSKDPERLKQIGEQFDHAVKNGRTPVLTEGSKYNGITVSLRDSQYIETQKWTAEEICRIYRVPPHMVGMMEHGNYNNSIEAQNHQFIQYCIRPLVESIEEEFENKLLSNRDFCLELDMQALLRGDIQTQVQRHVSYYNIGAMNVNEIRKENALAPVVGGDVYFTPMHMGQPNDINNGKENNPTAGPEAESTAGAGQ